MKLTNNIGNYFKRKSAWAGLMLVIVAAVTLAATSLIQYYFSQKGIREEASMRAESQLEATRTKILSIIGQTETAVRNSEWIARWALDYPDSVERVCQRIVTDNPVIMGSTMALVPGYNRSLPLFSPYVFQQGDSVVCRSLATEEYDYPSKEWFTKALDKSEGYWSEPYIDTGGGEILMTTFSVPIVDDKGVTAAVLTADISLDWLTEMVGNVKVYPNAFSMMVSRTGQIMVSPVETLVMRKTVNELTWEEDEAPAIQALNREMLSGKSGNMPIFNKGIKYSVYFAPVERTGWSMSIVIPDKEIYGGIRRISNIVKLLQLLGMLMLVFILRSLFKSQHKYNQLNENQRRLENELHIASGIQMAMIPKVSSAITERHELDMAASIVPAKEVGGDLYDFFIRNNRLVFCIGDVSGKGVPASLVMAVTRSMFRTIAARETGPKAIVSSLNDSLAEMNENNMFVTFFCGVLDLSTGLLKYCNAGHNPPMILTDAIRVLPVEANLPLGVIAGFDYKEQETQLQRDDALFLYTDGLSEAENGTGEQFGMERIKEALHGRKDSQAHLESIQGKVNVYVGNYPQSDDLSMLFIHYLGEEGRIDAHHLTLHNKVQQLSLLAPFIEAVAKENNLDKGLASSLNLALEEAVTNVVLYAYPTDTDGTIDIDAGTVDGGLKFVISDSGTPFDPTKAPEVNTEASVEERPIGGLGIHLVRNIMDSVQYEYKDGKNILTLTKNI